MTLSLGLVVGVELLAAAALLVLFGRSISRRWPRQAWLVSFGRVMLGVAGLGLVASATFLADTTPDSRLANPVPFTVTSVTAGAALYQANCAACHGLDARGGGPQAGTTQVRPPSLLSGHLSQHTDGDVYYWITNGLPGGMPTWVAKLSDADRWNLVNYLRSLLGRAPTSVGPASPPAAAGLASPLAVGPGSPSAGVGEPILLETGLPVGLGLLGLAFALRRARLPRRARHRHRGTRP